MCCRDWTAFLADEAVAAAVEAADPPSEYVLFLKIVAPYQDSSHMRPAKSEDRSVCFPPKKFPSTSISGNVCP